jgi:predicted enzyme related to lactoylglutathione lyase
LWEPVEDQSEDAPELWSEKVTGIGGVFFKSDDPKKLKEWYAKHLGVGDETFRWHDLNTPDATEAAQTIWAPFKKDTTYFSPSDKPYMINYRVNDLAGLLSTLEQQGVQQVGKVDEYPYGKFAWIMDPEGNKIELWEPKD